jgi:hypothetical protein
MEMYFTWLCKYLHIFYIVETQLCILLLPSTSHLFPIKVEIKETKQKTYFVFDFLFFLVLYPLFLLKKQNVHQLSHVF